MIYSVVIRARNAENDLQRCLKFLRQQLVPEQIALEFVVVDNESSDNTARVAQQNGAKVIFLPEKEFSWGRALNKGIEASSGDTILVISSDAHPADMNWVVNMVLPLEDNNVGVVYGRQIPHQDAPIDEIIRLKNKFPEKNFVFDKNYIEYKNNSIIASNACAAFKKKVWKIFPFDELVNGAEELVWVDQLLHSNYKIFYSSEAIVFHSHNDTLLKNACRLVELWNEATLRRQEKLSSKKFIKILLAYSKNRFFNILCNQVTLSKRFKGGIKLPLELALFIIVFLALKIGLYKRLRHHAWK